MYQPPVRFQKFVAIDWSGARNEIRNQKIQVAEYSSATRMVGLAHPIGGQPGDPWHRTDVVEYIQHTVNAVHEGPVLIGFDFAFAYPYCDRCAYFPGVNAVAPQLPQALWATVEQQCNGIGNFYGASFFMDCASPYRPFYKYPGFEGLQYEPRFRMTDQAVGAQAGRNPASVFSCFGQNQVGPGSVAGMRVLHEFLARVKVGRMAPISIWPFDANSAPGQSTLVEIYPRLFLNHAEQGDNQPPVNDIQALCGHFGAVLQNPGQARTDDQRDALVSAAGMGWFTQRGQVAWHVPAGAAEHEGWIFGVQHQ